jgi:hypothetical protein
MVMEALPKSADTDAPRPKLPVAVDLSYSCDTLQDWLAFDRPPVREGKIDDCLAVFTAAGDKANGLLAVAPGRQQLLHLRPTPEESPMVEGGWRSETVDVPDSRRGGDLWPRGDIYRLTALTEKGETLALVHLEEAGGAKRTYIEPMRMDAKSGTWKTWQLPGFLPQILLSTAQTEVYFDAAGEAMLYTKPTSTAGEDDRFALVFRGETEWEVAQASFPVRPGKPATFRLLANDDPTTLGTLLRLGDGNVVEFMRVRLEKPKDEDPYIEHPKEWQRKELTAFGAGDLDAARLIPLPERPGCFLLHAANGHLWLVSGLESTSPSVVPLTGTTDLSDAAAQVRVGLDMAPPDGGPPRVEIFIVDATRDRRVWVAREGKGSSAAAASFEKWVPLGEHVRALAIAPRLTSGAELFSIAQGRSTTIERHSFDRNGEAWLGSVVQTSRASLDEAVETVTHTVRVTLKTATGAAAPSARTGIEASFPCVAIIHGVARHLAPGSILPTQADDSGQLLIRIPANGPHAPVLTVHLGDNTKRTIAADEAVARRLAGKEKHHVVDQKRLENAGLLPQKLSPADKSNLTELVRTAGAEIGKRRTGVATLTNERPRWFHGTLVEGDSGEVTWKVAHGRGALPVVVTAESLLTATGETAAEGWGFVGDIFRWIVATGQKIAEWTVKFASDAAAFVIRIGKQTFDLTVRLAQGIVSGIEALFAGIAQAVGAVVDAARALLNVVKAAFDVDAIRRTNTAMRYCLDGAFRIVEYQVRVGLRDVLTGIVDKAFGVADDAIGAIESYVEGFTFAKLSAEGIPDQESGGSGVPGRAALLEKAGTSGRWIADRVAAHPERLRSSMVMTNEPLAADVVNRLTRLSELIQSDDEKKTTVFSILRKELPDVTTQFSEGKFSALSIVAVLRLVRKIIALTGSLMKAAITIVLEVIADAIKALRELLKVEISIPGVEQLGRLVLGRAPQVGDVMTLMLAAPTTILWKIVTLGKEEPFSPERLASLESSGFFPVTAAADEPDPEDGPPGFVVAYVQWQIEKLLKKKVDPELEKLLRQYAEERRRIAEKLVPVSTVLSFASAVASVLIVQTFGNVADTIDSLSTYGAGSNTAGWVGKIFLVITIILLGFSIWLGAVQSVTMELLPESEQAKKWKAQLDLLPPLDWVSLSWVTSFVLGVVGFLLLTAFGGTTPAGAYGNMGVTLILGVILCIGSVMYLQQYIEKNAKKIRLWKIAKEIGAILASIASVFKWLPPVINITLPVTSGASALAVPPYLLVSTAGNLIANITATGSLIDENMARNWSDFRTA